MSDDTTKLKNKNKNCLAFKIINRCSYIVNDKILSTNNYLIPSYSVGEHGLNFIDISFTAFFWV